MLRVFHDGGLRFALAALILLAMTHRSQAGQVRTNVGFSTNTLAPNDDGSTGLVSLGFTANFFGVSKTQAYVNNNGNITFDSPLSTFTPFSLTSTGRQIIAPFFADVDTRSAGNPVRYGTSTVNGHAAFGVNWIDVDYYPSSITHTNRNSFQLVLIDRSDTGAGNFDIEFNYDQIEWETGGASGGNSNGLGGASARAGFSNGTGAPGTSYEIAGSAVNGAFLDSNLTTGLIHNSNIGVPGRFLFEARNGIVAPPDTAVPEPASMTLLGLGVLGIAGYARRRRRKSALVK